MTIRPTNSSNARHDPEIIPANQTRDGAPSVSSFRIFFAQAGVSAMTLGPITTVLSALLFVVAAAAVLVLFAGTLLVLIVAIAVVVIGLMIAGALRGGNR